MKTAQNRHPFGIGAVASYGVRLATDHMQEKTTGPY